MTFARVVEDDKKFIKFASPKQPRSSDFRNR